MGGPAGAIYLAERDSLGNVLHSFGDGFAGTGSVSGKISVGSGKDVLGQPTYASAYVNDAGTFWAAASADNPYMPDDNGNALAYTSMLYRMRKDAPNASFSLNISNGQLFLADYGSAHLPLHARVEMNADVLSADGLTLYSRWTGFADLSGHGGIPNLTTYNWQSSGLSVTAGSYFEDLDSLGTTIVSAFLLIPESTVLLDLSAAPTGEQFLVNVTATALAYNQFAESTAFAFLRDPLKFDDPDPDPSAGASGVSFSGVSVAAAPEPGTAGLLASGVFMLVLARKRVLRRSAGAAPPGLLTRLSISLRRGDQPALVAKSMPRQSGLAQCANRWTTSDAHPEPVRNFVCEAWHDHKEHVCQR